MRRATSIFRAAAVALLSAGLGACGNTPTEITPLPRAIGEVEGVLLQVDRLQPLDAATQGVYHLWALLERSQIELLGAFTVSESGSLLDESGAVVDRFLSDAFAVRKALGILITIEIPGSSPETPQGMQILSGTFVDGVANMAVPISADIFGASGSLRVFSPTNGAGNNERSGVWMVDGAGNPSLDLPDTTAALQFETFVEINGRSLPVGRFERPDQADSANQYSSGLFPAPERPGEDFLTNAPEGLTFPADLSGARVSISLEGRVNDFVSRSQLVVLSATLPGGLVGGEIVSFVNQSAESFPTGRAVLY